MHIVILNCGAIGIYMHLRRIYITQLRFPYWPFYISSSYWYPRKISFKWV